LAPTSFFEMSSTKSENTFPFPIIVLIPYVSSNILLESNVFPAPGIPVSNKHRHFNFPSNASSINYFIYFSYLSLKLILPGWCVASNTLSISLLSINPVLIYVLSLYYSSIYSHTSVVLEVLTNTSSSLFYYYFFSSKSSKKAFFIIY
jgi:hypothetical protein